MCTNGKCHNAAGQTIDHLDSGSYSPFSQSKIAAVAKLKHVKAVAGGLALSDTSITIPKHFGQPGGSLPTPNSFNVQGVDTGQPSPRPLSAGTVTPGPSVKGGDAAAGVGAGAAGYAKP